MPWYFGWNSGSFIMSETLSMPTFNQWQNKCRLKPILWLVNGSFYSMVARIIKNCHVTDLTLSSASYRNSKMGYRLSLKATIHPHLILQYVWYSSNVRFFQGIYVVYWKISAKLWCLALMWIIKSPSCTLIFARHDRYENVWIGLRVLAFN